MQPPSLCATPASFANAPHAASTPEPYCEPQFCDVEMDALGRLLRLPEAVTVPRWNSTIAAPGGVIVQSATPEPHRKRKKICHTAPLPLRRAERTEAALLPYFKYTDLRAKTPVEEGDNAKEMPLIAKPVFRSKIYQKIREGDRQRKAEGRKAGRAVGKLTERRREKVLQMHAALEEAHANRLVVIEGNYQHRLKAAQETKADRPKVLARLRAEQLLPLLHLARSLAFFNDIRVRLITKRVITSLLLPYLYRMRNKKLIAMRNREILDSIGDASAEQPPSCSDIRKVEMFSNWNDEELTALISSMKLKLYACGDHVGFQGEPVLWMHVISAGSMAFSKVPTESKKKHYSCGLHCGSKEEGDVFLWECLCMPYEFAFSVICAADSAVWVISKDTFDQVLNKQSDALRQTHLQYSKFLQEGNDAVPLGVESFRQSLKIFRDPQLWEDADLLVLIQTMRPKILFSGMHLLCEGDFGNDLFYIERGTVVIHALQPKFYNFYPKDEAKETLFAMLQPLASSGPEGGRDTLVATIKSGAGCGEYPLVWSEPRSCTATAFGTVTCWILSKSVFQEAILRHPDRFISVKKVLAPLRELRQQRPENVSAILGSHSWTSRVHGKEAVQLYAKLLKASIPLVLTAGELLHLKGDGCKHVYLLVAGNVEVGDTVKKRTTPCGLYVGAMEALVEGAQWRYSLRASGRCILWCLSAPAFVHFLHKALPTARFEAIRREAHLELDSPFTKHSANPPKLDAPNPTPLAHIRRANSGGTMERGKKES